MITRFCSARIALWSFASLMALSGTGALGQSVKCELGNPSLFPGEKGTYRVTVVPGRGSKIAHPPSADAGLTIELLEEGVAGLHTVNGRDLSPYVFVYEVSAAAPGDYVIRSPRISLNGRERTGSSVSLKVLDPKVQAFVRVESSAEPESPVLGERVTITTRAYLEHLPAGVQDGSSADPLQFNDRAERGIMRTRLRRDSRLSPLLKIPGYPKVPFGAGAFDVGAWLRRNQPADGEKGLRLDFDDRNQPRVKGVVRDLNEVRDGEAVKVRVYEFKQSLLADIAGRFDLGAATLGGEVPRPVDGKLFWQRFAVRSEPVVVTVSEPPVDGRPADYGNAVGTFSLEVSPPVPSKVAVGDVIYLTVVVRGSGIFEGLGFDLERALGDGFLVEEPKVLDSLPAGAERPDGFPARPGRWRQFEFRVRPQRATVEEIPALSWSYFDPNAKRYVSLKSKAYPLEIFDPRSGPSGVVVATDGEAAGSQLERVAAVLSPNVEDLNQLEHRPLRFWAFAGTILALLPLHFLIAAVVGRWRRLHADPAILRRRQSMPRARKGFEHARCTLTDGDVTSALNETLDVARGFVADVENQSERAITGEEIVAWARDHGAEDDLVEVIESLTESTEALRFGGQAPPEDQALEVLDKVRMMVELAPRGPRPGPKTGLWIGMLALCCSSAMAQDQRGLESAQRLFDAGEYAASAKAFEAMDSATYSNPWVWFNAGNAWMKAGELGHAIAAYRRAEPYLRDDANWRRNLNRALAQREGVLEGADEPDLARTLFFWQSDLSLPGQLRLALAAGVFAFFGGLLRSLRGRWLPLTRALTVTLALLCVVFVAGAWVDHSRHSSGGHGVVVKDRVVVRSAPEASSQEALSEPLRVGTEFEVAQLRSDWIEVRLPGDLGGWIPRRAVSTY